MPLLTSVSSGFATAHGLSASHFWPASDPRARAARLLTVRNGELAKFERQTGKTLRESGQVGHDHPLKTFKDVPRREAKEPIVNKSGPGDQGPSVLQCYHRKALVGLELLCPYPVQTFQT